MKRRMSAFGPKDNASPSFITKPPANVDGRAADHSQLDTRRPDHFVPFLGEFDDELAKLGG